MRGSSKGSARPYPTPVFGGRNLGRVDAPASKRSSPVVDGWALTARISPRDDVRIAAVDSAGQVQNLYPHVAQVSGPAPVVPWAVHLTDGHRQFHLIAFDLDLSQGDGNVLRDCRRLTRWLDELAIEYTIAQSGPSGGRHVWLSLLEPIAAHEVAQLADAVALALPTLDVSSLKNPATGAVRPPGAPHRRGGHSVVLAGPPQLLRPAVTAEQIGRL